MKKLSVILLLLLPSFLVGQRINPNQMQPGTAGETLQTSGSTATWLPNTPVASLVAFGAKCDNSTDDTAAFQSAINWVVAQAGGGGIVDVNGQNICYIANPTTFTWGRGAGEGPAALITIRISGKGLRFGSTFMEYDAIDFRGNSSTTPAQFQASGTIGLIQGPTGTGTMGTVITGTGSQTFTPSVMTGIYPGAAISIAEDISCTPSSMTGDGSYLVTAVCPSAFHVPPGGQLVVSGSSCTSGYVGSNFLINSSDYPSNTVTWIQSGNPGGTATGCTITAFNEDRAETVAITATTATTATATFRLPHASSATWGLVTIEQVGSDHHNIDSIQLQGGTGMALWLNQTFFSRSSHFWVNGDGGLASGSVENDAQGEIWFDEQSYMGGDLLIPSVGYPIGMHAACVGSTYVEDSYVAFGVKYDCPVNNEGLGQFVFKNVVFERAGRAAFTYNPVPLNGSGSVTPPLTMEFTNSLNQDNLDGYTTEVPYVFSTTPSAINTFGSMVKACYFWNPQFNAIVNSYAQLPIDWCGGTGTAQLPVGRSFPTGVYNSGTFLKGERDGEQAGFGPQVIPFTTLATSAISCSTCSSVRAPDGTTNAIEIDNTTGNVSVTVGNLNFSTYAGDHFIYGAWVRQGEGQTQPASAAGGNIPFQLISAGTDTFGSSQTNISNPQNFGPWFASGEGWHAQVVLDTIATGESTSHTLQLRAYSGATAGTGNQFYYPFWIFIPGPNNPSYAGVTTDEVERTRESLLHGLVPSSFSSPGTAYSPLPQSIGGLILQNVTGSTQCLEANSSGVVGGTGAACGSGGSGIGSITWSMPSFMTASPSTISASGTQTFSFNTESNHLFLGNNSGSTAAPTFSQPAFTDLSGSLGTAQGPTGITNVLYDNAGTLQAATAANIGTLLNIAQYAEVYSNGTTAAPLGLAAPTVNADWFTGYHITGSAASAPVNEEFVASTTNAVGLTVTPTYNATGPTQRFEVTGTSYTGNSATATNLSSYPTLCSGGQFSQGLSSGSNNCASPSGSGTVNTGTSGHIAYYASSTNAVSSDANLDDGATTANTLTYAGSGGVTAPQFTASGGSTHGLTIPAGTAVSGASGKVVYASDSTNGYAEVNENNTGLSRLCTAANGICGSGTVSDGSGTSTPDKIAVSTELTHNINYEDLPETHQVVVAGCDGHSGTATAATALSLPTSGFPTPTCRAGTNNLNGVLQFGVSESAQFQLELPVDYDSSTLPYIRINYTQATATASQTIAYQIQVGCSTTSDDPSFATAQAFTTTTTGSTANTPYTQTLEFNSTSMTNCSGGDVMNFKISTTSSSNGSSNLQLITLTIPRLINVEAN